MKRFLVSFWRRCYFLLVWRGTYQFLIVISLLLGLFLPGFLIQSPTLVIGGSTSVFTMFNHLSTLAREQKVPFIYNSMGSFAAIRAVEREIFAIGFMSKKPPQQLPEGMQTQFVVTDAILIIYHLPPSCQFVKGTKLDANRETVQKIYRQHQNWNDLASVSCDGPAVNSRLIRLTRENGSGTRSVFEQKLGFAKSTDYQFKSQMKSSGAVLRFVDENPGAIAYISASYQKKIDSLPNVAIGTNTAYLARPFYALYLTKHFSKIQPLFRFVFCNEQAQTKVKSLGFIYDLTQTKNYC